MASAAQEDLIAAVVSAARAALASVAPGQDTPTAKAGQRQFADSVSALERSLRILEWEKNRQAPAGQKSAPASAKRK